MDVASSLGSQTSALASYQLVVTSFVVVLVFCRSSIGEDSMLLLDFPSLFMTQPIWHSSLFESVVLSFVLIHPFRMQFHFGAARRGIGIAALSCELPTQ